MPLMRTFIYGAGYMARKDASRDEGGLLASLDAGS